MVEGVALVVSGQAVIVKGVGRFPTYGPAITFEEPYLKRNPISKGKDKKSKLQFKMQKRFTKLIFKVCSFILHFESLLMHPPEYLPPCPPLSP
jgi:uncharacterized membrane protein